MPDIISQIEWNSQFRKQLSLLGNKVSKILTEKNLIYREEQYNLDIKQSFLQIKILECRNNCSISCIKCIQNQIFYDVYLTSIFSYIHHQIQSLNLYGIKKASYYSDAFYVPAKWCIPSDFNSLTLSSV